MSFIDDSANHSQGDADLKYVPGKCMNVVWVDDQTGEEQTCDEPCNPAEQLCHYCRTSSHRIYY